MRRGWVILGVVVLLIAGLTGVAVYRVLHTQAGLDFVLRQLDRVPGIRIDVQGARGTLAGSLAVDRVVVEHDAVHIDLRGLRVTSDLSGLTLGRLRLAGLAVDRADVRLKPRPPQPKSEPHFLPAWLRIDAPGWRVSNLDLTLQGGQHLAVSQVQGSLALTRWRLTLDPVDVQGPAGRVAGAAALRASEPLGLQTDLRGNWRFPEDAFEYRFRAKTRGKLDQLAADVFLDAPTRISFQGTLLDLDETPRAQGTLRFVDFDGAPWMPPGRLPKLTGTIALAAGRQSLGLDGTITTPALPGQQVRLQGSARIDERTIDLAGLRAWLPRLGLALTVAGKAQLPGEDAAPGTLPHVAINGEWTAFRWPLTADAKPLFTSPEGVFTFEGAMPYRFTMRAEAKGAAIPPVTLDAVGLIDKVGLRLDRVDAYTLRGRIQGNGRLAWSGQQPWAFDVVAKSLAIGELRKGVDGRIDARGSIRGTGLTAAAPWTAKLESLSGTLFGRSLTGRGELTHLANGQYEVHEVRIANGASHADVNGRFGPNALDLAWNVDLRSLAIVTNDLKGELVSAGTARGTLQRPELRGNANLRNVSYGSLKMLRGRAEVDFDSSDARASRIALQGESIDAGGLKVDEVEAGLDGYLRDHTIKVTVSSPGDPERKITSFDGSLHAQGTVDLARKSWEGNLDGAAVEFPDGEARLIQPSAIALSPAEQRASPLCLRTADDARFCVEGEHHLSPKSWRVLYSAEDWPLKRLLSSVLGWREFDGRLQASGWAQQEPGKDWVGGTTVLVHDPSLDIPRNKFRTERIQLGSSRLDLYAEETRLRATVDLVVDETTRMQGEALADRRADLLASPLRGQISGSSEAIQVLPLLLPEVDRASGRLNGQITLAGTLGRPEFTGDFHLRDGRLELYRTNLIVSALQADGTFEGEELRFKAQGSTAKGALSVDGHFRWPGGVMTGEMRLVGDQLLVADTPEYRVLASPDIVLRAGADGYRVEGQVVIPTARISPREITTSVSSSSDERIVGVDTVDDTEQQPSTANRVSSKVDVVLGDNVRVVAYGLKARLDGEVAVSTVPNDVARGNGTIRVAEGQYKAFGQDVKVTKGLLTYHNSPLTEPSLEIVAEREIKDTDIKVAVNVRGTLEEPYISITSTPTMSSNEALSYLLTGHSIDTLQSGEAASVNQAAESLAMSGGGLLLGGIGSRLGLDEFSVEKESDTGDTSVVLGKAISPKLFVSYGISIAEAINTIKLRYTLNNRWAVKAESGLDQSADIEYKIER